MTVGSPKRSNFKMSTGKNLAGFILILSLIALFGVTSCKNPLVGLGARVDLTPPEGTVTGIANGDYVSGDITLTGTIEDDKEVDGVWAEINGVQVPGDVSPDGTWVINVITTDPAYGEDGEKNIVISLRDTSGKITEKQMLLYFDNTPPVVVVKWPVGYASGSYSDAVLSIKGEAADPFRIRKVEIELAGGSGTLDAVSGTNSWSSVLHSIGTGNYSIIVTAEDYAGNRSSHFYHYDDILVENNDTFITSEDIYRVENGESLSSLTPQELSGIELNQLPISISMDIDNPVITISNPDPNALVSENVFSLNAKFLGSIEDDDGVNTTTSAPQISIDGGAWVPVQTITGTGLFVKWEHSITFDVGDSGDHTLQIKATDIYGVEDTSLIAQFRINAGAPTVEITSPDWNAYLKTPIFNISGTATAANNLTDIQVSLDNGLSWNNTSFTSSQNVAWTYTTGAMIDGIISIKARASTDSGGTWSYSNIQVTIDTQAPTGSFSNPSKGAYVNGDVNIIGTSSDNNLLSLVEIKVGENRGWVTIPDAEKYNWTYTIDSLDYENGTDAVETPPGSGVFKINVYSRITDVAGNVTTSAVDDYFFYIDNALDSPTVTIISPQEDASLGGSVIVSGISYDDDAAPLAVYMQIDVNTPSGGTPNFSDTITLSSPIDFDGPGGNAPVTDIDESVSYMLSGVNPWSVDLNTNGELYDTDGAGSHTGDIFIRVFAEDINNLTGSSQDLHFKLDDNIPLITNLSPDSDTYVKGTFHLTADVSDETQIRHLEISYDGGSTSHYIIKDGVIQAPYGSGSVATDYAMDVTVDTSNIPDVGNVSSGLVNFRLKVTDDTNYQSEKSLTYYVDNTLPSGWMSMDSTDIFGSGDDAVFSGYADDTGTVSGVNKIIAYFEKDGNFYNPRDGSFTPVTTDTINGSVVPFPSDTDYHLVIDDTGETLAGGDSDGDGIAEELNIGTWYEWKFQVDSNNIPDGKSTLHYVVYDNAGNRYHDTKYPVFVKNDKPSINEMKVGYDLDKNGTVEGGEIFSYSGEFKARNKLYFEFISTDGGGIVDYAVYEGTDATGTEVFSAVSGTIDISGFSDGSVSYFCQITDGDDITAEKTILVNIDNVDDVNPVINLDSLTSGSVVDGHLEVSGKSLHNGTDPDVSGIVEFTGTASDDQGMQYIKINLDGTETTLASWSGGFFISENGDFIIDTQSIDPINGHQVSWTYEWDTSAVTGVAKNNVAVSFTVEDFGTPVNSDTSSTSVDVVPYVSRLNTSVTDSFSDAFSRSAAGNYPVRINSNDGTFETITVFGYNLNPTATGASSDVRLSLDADGIDGVTKKGIGLTYGNIAADFTQLDVNLERGIGGVATGNGYLNIFTNGIPSINNINDNLENSEADYINPNLKDDRYLSLWDLRLLRNEFSLANNAVYPTMSMNGNNPEFSYVNNSQGWGIALYLDGTTEKYVYENWDLFTFTAIDHNSSGNDSLLYDINVVNGNYGDYNSGNYGGILTKYFYDVPATSWNYWSYRFNDHQVWLENLVDEDDGTTAVLNRYQNPDIFTVGTTADTDIFYTVYDNLKDKIVFRTFHVGTNASIDDVTGGRINDTGTALYTSIPQYEGDNSFPEYNGDRRFEGNNNAGKTPPGQQLIDEVNTSQFAAVAATADGSTAVVAYYDASGTGIVRLKYNNTPTNAGTWVDLGILDTGHGGENIDVKIDSANAIHIAYYDNNQGDLCYIYIPAASGTPTWNTIDAETYIVDSYFDVGEKLTLEINSGNIPVIAYKGVNRSGKVAWLTGSRSDGSDSNDQFTGSWEIVILPTQIVNTDSNKYSIGVDSSDLPVVGYTNGGLEYIRMLSDLTD